MFGFVTASFGELTKDRQTRYSSVYCGICRRIRAQSSEISRLSLSYDMAFLALLLMSLYEPEECAGESRCLAHPLHRKPWVDNAYIRYAADMNVALAYYKALDDWTDDGKLPARVLASQLRPHLERIRGEYPRQCGAIEGCIRELSRLEKENTPNPDLPAGTFGRLMAELMVYREDLWAEDLRSLGFQLGRFIYLADAMLDYDRDERKHSYNPFLAMGGGKDIARWEQYLLLAMGRCTESYERLPLVQDKDLLDNILYSGIWIRWRAENREEDHHGAGSL